MAARRIATLLFLLLGLGAGSALAAPPAPPPLITNGDFEDSSVLPWFTNGAARLAGPADWTAASGAQSLELFSYGFAQQTVATTAGQRYDLSFAYAGNPSTTCAPMKTLAVTWNDGDPAYGPDGTTLDFDTTGQTTASMGWQTAHVLVDAASTDTYVKFRDYGGAACGVVIDNVSMRAPSAGQTGIELTTGGIYPEYGTALPMTATVIGATAATTPTGAVQFAVDGVSEGSPVALSDGQAQTSVSGLEPGEHTVSASYVPDSGSFTSSDVTRRVTAVQAGTSTALNVYPGPTPLGEEVVATADVSRMFPGSGQITGAVQFGDEFGPIGDPVEIDSNGIAQVGLLEDVGYHYLYATYLGDDFFGTSTGNATLEIFDPNPPPATGGPIATTVSMTSSKNPANPGDSYAITATVVPSTPSDLPLDGTIAFSIGTTPVGEPIPLDAGRSASVTLTAPSGGARQAIRASYSGNAHFSRSVGRLTQVISSPPPASSPPPPVPSLVCNLAPRAVQLKRALTRGATSDISCNRAVHGKLLVSISRTQARRLGFKGTGPVVIARGDRSLGPTAAQFALRATFPKKYRKRLVGAKRLVLSVKFAGWADGGLTTSVTQRLTLKR